MEDSFPRAWTSPDVAVEELFGLTDGDTTGPLRGPHHPREFARKLFAYEALQPAAAAPPRPELDPEPYSLQWFLNIENQRHSKHARWIPKLMEFAKHSGERLLGLGHGLGTDWAQYANHGARVLVCTSSTAQLDLIRRNFALRGLTGSFIHAAPTRLPLDSASVDVACISSLYHGIDHPQGVVEEVYRVLKPGGKVLAVTPARYDVDSWCRVCFFWYRWLVPQKHRSKPKREERYSAWALRRLFHRFAEHRTYKRQLRRAEVPHVWRWLPLPFLARLMGRVLVLKAFKPVK
jgi:ubiquinone/menaquinone biosynthesis C-methylase UbiE